MQIQEGYARSDGHSGLHRFTLHQDYSSAFSSVVKDVAVAFQLPLQWVFSDQASVDESKKLGEGIPSAASSAETQIPAPLPLPTKFALPPSHWIPHPLVFRPSTLPPAQGALEAQVPNPTEFEEPIQTAVLEDFQLRTTTIEESDPRTWLPPPPPQLRLLRRWSHQTFLHVQR